MSEQRAVTTVRPAIDGTVADQAGWRVVVVLGSGRSGTSLCAKILARLGIRMEATLQRPNEMNPEGYFEDGRLVEINKRLLDKLAPVPGSGPRGDAAAAKIGPEMRELREHLSEGAFATAETWGFKDPRVSMLLPFYRRAFQAIGVVPHYVFCARAPGAVVESLQQAGTRSRQFYEQLYFVRSFLALRDCAANCHVIHYERLLDDPAEQIEKLWAYVGDDGPFRLKPKECQALVDKKLNRSELRAAPVSNPLAARMGALIDGMEGAEFDRDAVFAELREIDAIHAGYQVWVDQAAQAIGSMKTKTETTESRLAKQAERITKLTTTAEAHAEEVGELADARMRVAEQTDEIERLRANLQAALDESERRSERAEARLERLQERLEGQSRQWEASRTAAKRQAEESEARIAALNREAEGRATAEAQAEDLAEQVKTLHEEVEGSRAEAERHAESAEARIAELTAQHEHDSMELIRGRDEALAHAERQEACAKVLAAELPALQADLARLDKERNAAITRTRSREGEFEELHGNLEQATVKLTRLQRREKKLKTEAEELLARLQTAERNAAEAKAEDERLEAQLQQRTDKLRARNQQLREQLQQRTDKLKARNQQLREQLQQRAKKMKARNQQLRASLQKAERWNILALPRRLTRIRTAGRPDETSR